MSQQPWDNPENTGGHYGQQNNQSSQNYQGNYHRPEPSPQQDPYAQPEYTYTQPITQQPQSPNTSQSKKRFTAAVTSAAVIAALVGGGVGGGVVAVANSSSGSSVTTTNNGTSIINNTKRVTDTTAAAAKATPSVVTIGVTSSAGSGSGSGIILDTDGHILTNTHVVTMDGGTNNPNIEVQMSDGSVRNATIVGTDPTSDLAVIKVDTAGLDITPATIGDSDALNVGDVSVAIGAPLGLANTVTDGIISTLSRTIEVASSEAPSDGSGSSGGESEQDSPFEFQVPGQERQQNSTSSTIAINVLQTDAAINPGNSGGALVDDEGKVIGVNVAIASTSSSSTSSSGNIGVGFAIPINYAKRIADDLIQTGKASHGLLGASVSTSPANDDKSEVFGDGALVKDVTSGGAADKAGIKEGDVITAINDQTVSEASELTAAVRQSEPGTTVKITYTRDGTTHEADVTVDDSADS